MAALSGDFFARTVGTSHISSGAIHASERVELRERLPQALSKVFSVAEMGNGETVNDAAAAPRVRMSSSSDSPDAARVWASVGRVVDDLCGLLETALSHGLRDVPKTTGRFYWEGGNEEAAAGKPTIVAASIGGGSSVASTGSGESSEPPLVGGGEEEGTLNGEEVPFPSSVETNNSAPRGSSSSGSAEGLLDATTEGSAVAAGLPATVAATKATGKTAKLSSLVSRIGTIASRTGPVDARAIARGQHGARYLTLWDVAANIIPLALVQRLQDVFAATPITTGAGKARVWLRLSLNDSSLLSQLQSLFGGIGINSGDLSETTRARVQAKANAEMLSNYYHDWAFVRSGEDQQFLLSLLVGLSGVAFDVVCDDPAFNDGGKTSPLETYAARKSRQTADSSDPRTVKKKKSRRRVVATIEGDSSATSPPAPGKLWTGTGADDVPRRLTTAVSMAPPPTIRGTDDLDALLGFQKPPAVSAAPPPASRGTDDLDLLLGFQKPKAAAALVPAPAPTPLTTPAPVPARIVSPLSSSGLDSLLDNVTFAAKQPKPVAVTPPLPAASLASTQTPVKSVGTPVPIAPAASQPAMPEDPLAALDLLLSKVHIGPKPNAPTGVVASSEIVEPEAKSGLNSVGPKITPVERGDLVFPSKVSASDVVIESHSTPASAPLPKISVQIGLTYREATRLIEDFVEGNSTSGTLPVVKLNELLRGIKHPEARWIVDSEWLKRDLLSHAANPTEPDSFDLAAAYGRLIEFVEADTSTTSGLVELVPAPQPFESGPVQERFSEPPVLDSHRDEPQVIPEPVPESPFLEYHRDEPVSEHPAIEDRDEPPVIVEPALTVILSEPSENIADAPGSKSPPVHLADIHDELNESLDLLESALDFADAFPSDLDDPDPTPNQPASDPVEPKILEVARDLDDAVLSDASDGHGLGDRKLSDVDLLLGEFVSLGDKLAQSPPPNRFRAASGTELLESPAPTATHQLKLSTTRPLDDLPLSKVSDDNNDVAQNSGTTKPIPKRSPRPMSYTANSAQYDMVGWMKKRGAEFLAAWRSRWFALDSQAYSLLYFTGPDLKELKGTISLQGVAILCDPRKPLEFQIQMSNTPSEKGRTYYLWLDKPTDCMAWVDALKSVIRVTKTDDATPVTADSARNALERLRARQQEQEQLRQRASAQRLGFSNKYRDVLKKTETREASNYEPRSQVDLVLEHEDQTQQVNPTDSAKTPRSAPATRRTTSGRLVLDRLEFRDHEKGTADTQRNVCFDCNQTLHSGILFSGTRYCEYTGKFFCKNCHHGENSIIPVRVVLYWDMTPRPVCDAAKRLISRTFDDPSIVLTEVNPSLYAEVPSLTRVRLLRRQLHLMRGFVLSCQNNRDSLMKPLFALSSVSRQMAQGSSRLHLVSTTESYSMGDFVDIASGELLPLLRRLSERWAAHITRCATCKAKGTICEVCEIDEPIFPWHLRDISRCSQCSSLYHQACFKDGVNACPKCLRAFELRERKRAEAQALEFG